MNNREQKLDMIVENDMITDDCLFNFVNNEQQSSDVQ